MLEVLKSSTGTNLTSDLGHVVRSLQACSLTPGFIDVYNEDKESVGQHGNRILNVSLRYYIVHVLNNNWRAPCNIVLSLKLMFCEKAMHVFKFVIIPRENEGITGWACPSVRLSVCLSVCLSVPLKIGYFVHASWVWRSWARAFKLYTRINQGLKTCLVKVSSRSVENCRF